MSSLLYIARGIQMNRLKLSSERYLLILMLLYIVTLVAVVAFVRWMPHSPWRVPLALLPAVPVFFGLYALIDILQGIDELQKRIHLQAIGFAAGALVCTSATYGFLELLAGFPTLSWIWIIPLLACFWGIGLMLATKRYA